MSSPKPTDSEQLEKQITELFTVIDNYGTAEEARAFIRQLIAQRDQQRLSAVPAKPVFPEVMEYIAMVEKASENNQYDDMYENGWKACLAALTAALGPDNSKIEEKI